MTVNITVKRKDNTPVDLEEVYELMDFCDSVFGLRDDGEHWFKHFATDKHAVYSSAEDIDDSLNINVFEKYSKEHPEMSVYVEFVME